MAPGKDGRAVLAIEAGLTVGGEGTQVGHAVDSVEQGEDQEGDEKPDKEVDKHNMVSCVSNVNDDMNYATPVNPLIAILLLCSFEEGEVGGYSGEEEEHRHLPNVHEESNGERQVHEPIVWPSNTLDVPVKYYID